MTFILCVLPDQPHIIRRIARLSGNATYKIIEVWLCTNFDTEFTSEEPILTPAKDSRPIHDEDEEHFAGFDYINEWWISWCWTQSIVIPFFVFFFSVNNIFLIAHFSLKVPGFSVLLRLCLLHFFIN